MTKGMNMSLENGKKEEVPVQENEIIERAALPTAIEISLDSQKAIARLQSINQVIDGAVKVALNRTNHMDWVKIGGKLYCQASGIQKMRAVFGIYYTDREIIREDSPDGSFSYTATGKVGSKLLDGLYGAVAIEIIGGRSSADPFFAKGGRQADPMDVKKAALANWEVRAVTALLGMGNLTEEDLKRNGINTDKIGTVDFKKGAEGGGDASVISDAQMKLLFARAKSKGMTEAQLDAYIYPKYKIDSKLKIKRSDFSELLSWLDAQVTK